MQSKSGSYVLRIDARLARRDRATQAIAVALFREGRRYDQHPTVAEFVAEHIPILGSLPLEAVDKRDDPVKVADQEMPEAQRPDRRVNFRQLARADDVGANGKQPCRQVRAQPRAYGPRACGLMLALLRAQPLGGIGDFVSVDELRMIGAKPHRVIDTATLVGRHRCVVAPTALRRGADVRGLADIRALIGAFVARPDRQLAAPGEGTTPPRPRRDRSAHFLAEFIPVVHRWHLTRGGDRLPLDHSRLCRNQDFCEPLGAAGAAIALDTPIAVARVGQVVGQRNPWRRYVIKSIGVKEILASMLEYFWK